MQLIWFFVKYILRLLEQEKHCIVKMIFIFSKFKLQHQTELINIISYDALIVWIKYSCKSLRRYHTHRAIMSRAWLYQLVILFYFGQCCSSLETRNVKAITNTDFKDVKVTEIPLETLMVRSKMECIVACRKSSSCLSFTFNDDSKDCYLFAQDFVHVADTQTIDEKGWNYYYLVAGLFYLYSKCVKTYVYAIIL